MARVILLEKTARTQQLNRKLLADDSYTKKILRSTGKVTGTADYSLEKLRWIIKNFESKGGTVVFIPRKEDRVSKIKIEGYLEANRVIYLKK